MEYYTYLYIDPKTNNPVYVGKGKNDRAYSHKKYVSNRRLTYLLKKRIKEGFIVEPILTYHKDELTAYAMEIFWIAVYGREDKGTGTLFNLTDGGDSPPNGKGRKQSEESKNKIRLANIGKIKSAETINKIKEKRALQVMIAVTEERKEKTRKSNTGKIRTKETCERIGNSKLGNNFGSANKSRVTPEETKLKLSEAMKESWKRRQK